MVSLRITWANHLGVKPGKALTPIQLGTVDLGLSQVYDSQFDPQPLEKLEVWVFCQRGDHDNFN